MMHTTRCLSLAFPLQKDAALKKCPDAWRWGKTGGFLVPQQPWSRRRRDGGIVTRRWPLKVRFQRWAPEVRSRRCARL